MVLEELRSSALLRRSLGALGDGQTATATREIARYTYIYTYIYNYIYIYTYIKPHIYIYTYI